MWGKEAKSHITRDKHEEKVAEAYRVVEQEYGLMPRNGRRDMEMFRTRGRI